MSSGSEGPLLELLDRLPKRSRYGGVIGNMEQGSTSLSSSDCSGYGNTLYNQSTRVFLSHSGAQEGFVEQLCVNLERCDHHPCFDKRRDSLPIGKEFPKLIFDAIEQCEVGVVVLSEEFFTSKWLCLHYVPSESEATAQVEVRFCEEFLSSVVVHESHGLVSTCVCSKYCRDCQSGIPVLRKKCVFS